MLPERTTPAPEARPSKAQGVRGADVVDTATGATRIAVGGAILCEVARSPDCLPEPGLGVRR